MYATGVWLGRDTMVFEYRYEHNFLAAWGATVAGRIFVSGYFRGCSSERDPAGPKCVGKFAFRDNTLYGVWFFVAAANPIGFGLALLLIGS